MLKSWSTERVMVDSADAALEKIKSDSRDGEAFALFCLFCSVS